MLAHLPGDYRLMGLLLYGAGLRLMECVRLRVKDVDLARRQLMVREAKGQKDRATVLPQSVLPGLREHLSRVRTLHRQDLARGHGRVFLPGALERKNPAAATAWAWQYVFPAPKLSVDPRGREVRRHHVGEKNLQNAVKAAIRKAGVTKAASCHTFRHSFATHLLEGAMTFAATRSRASHPSGLAAVSRPPGRSAAPSRNSSATRTSTPR